MKLEYFDGACEGRGLLLLYGDIPREVEDLRAAVRDLMVAGTTIQLHDLEFVTPVADCRLTAASVPKGRGVLRFSGGAFRWSLSPSEWEDTDAMLEPFCNASAAQAGVRFQYLNPHAGPEVIYSTGRQW
jgi:hypothetical protein